ncbi:MAG: hypothetical protein NG740_00910 [Omnitrophica bacterium]|nr:hypothetical protein [Candidatus Omnitrophota bacterium]
MNKEIVVGTWLWAGFEHFFVGFLLEEQNWNIHSTFFCCMGLECFCKAYILACRSTDYEHLNFNEAKGKIDNIARSLSHKLREMLMKMDELNKDIEIASTFKQDFDGYKGEQLVDVLEAAYNESRYPVSSSISSKYPMSGTELFLNPLRSSGIAKFSYSIGRQILLALKNKYTVGITEKVINVRTLSRGEGNRFCNLFFANEMDKYVMH